MLVVVLMVLRHAVKITVIQCISASGGHVLHSNYSARGINVARTYFTVIIVATILCLYLMSVDTMPSCIYDCKCKNSAVSFSYI